MPPACRAPGWALIAAGYTDLLTVGPAIIIASMLGLAAGLGHRIAVPLWVIGVVGSTAGIAQHGLRILGSTENAQALTLFLSIVAGLAALFFGLMVHSHSLHYRRVLLCEVDELSPFEPHGNDAPELVKACLSEPPCEAYRQAVLKQGRTLMLAEAKAMIAYASDAPSRKSKERRERQQTEAWAKLCSREPMRVNDERASEAGPRQRETQA